MLFFLNGPGSTGKTFVYNTVCHKLWGDGLIVLCVASSGIAAFLLSSGWTAHSVFKIPIDLHEDLTCSISKESALVSLIWATALIIWDEVTMQNRYAMEAVDRTLHDLLDNEQPFGGITVVFDGDPQQILSVVVKESREEIVGALLQQSYLWQHIKLLHLQQNMHLERQPENTLFAHWQLHVGHGQILEDNGTIPLPDSMICTDTNELICSIYPRIDSTPTPTPE